MDQPVEAVEGNASPPAPFQTLELISALQVSQITGLSKKRIREAAAAGHLTVYRPPAGVRALTRYSKASALALAQMMITPATVSQSQRPTEVAADES